VLFSGRWSVSGQWSRHHRAQITSGENAAEASTAGTMTRSALTGLTLNGREPWMYPKDVLERLPTHPNSRNEKLLPHRWKVPSDS